MRIKWQKPHKTALCESSLCEDWYTKQCMRDEKLDSEAKRKMKDWHDGLRKQNVKGLSDEKLERYYKACRLQGYTEQMDILGEEIDKRKLKVPGRECDRLKRKEDGEIVDTSMPAAIEVTPDVIEELKNGYAGLQTAVLNYISRHGYKDYVEMKTKDKNCEYAFEITDRAGFEKVIAYIGTWLGADWINIKCINNMLWSKKINLWVYPGTNIPSDDFKNTYIRVCGEIEEAISKIKPFVDGQDKVKEWPKKTLKSTGFTGRYDNNYLVSENGLPLAEARGEYYKKYTMDDLEKMDKAAQDYEDFCMMYNIPETALTDFTVYRDEMVFMLGKMKKPGTRQETWICVLPYDKQNGGKATQLWYTGTKLYSFGKNREGRDATVHTAELDFNNPSGKAMEYILSIR